MVQTPYRKGYNFERLVANKLRQIVDDILEANCTRDSPVPNNYYIAAYKPLVIESRGSKGAIDVVLIIDDKAVAVQCKKRKPSDKSMLRTMEANANKHCITTYFAYQRNRKVVFYPDVVGRIRDILFTDSIDPKDYPNSSHTNGYRLG